MSLTITAGEARDLSFRLADAVAHSDWGRGADIDKLRAGGKILAMIRQALPDKTESSRVVVVSYTDEAANIAAHETMEFLRSLPPVEL